MKVRLRNVHVWTQLCSRAVDIDIASHYSPIVPDCYIAPFTISANGPLYATAAGNGIVFVNHALTYLHIERLDADLHVVTVPTVIEEELHDNLNRQRLQVHTAKWFTITVISRAVFVILGIA
eukprot:SAG11_NODE_1809_length_4224_cov_5.960000_6_plen_122_part_00